MLKLECEECGFGKWVEEGDLDKELEMGCEVCEWGYSVMEEE